MLVVSRTKDQVTVITTPQGERIYVTVVAVRGEKVRMGFKSDPSITIHRAEVQEKIDAKQSGVGERPERSTEAGTEEAA